MSLRPFWPSLEEREFFEREGYLVVENALSPDQTQRLAKAVDRCGSDGNPGFFNRLDILGLDDSFIELVTNPPVLAKIAGFLGWNIWVNHTHYNVRPPDPPDETYSYHWHKDGGTFSADLQGEPPMTAIKVGFYLTDLSQPNMGQTYLIPKHFSAGKHYQDQLGPNSPPPTEAKLMKLKPGSAVLFQQRTIHSQGSPNHSQITRKTIFVQWAFRWLFPVDTMTLGNLENRTTDPIQRQMLGFTGQRPSGRLASRYYPSDVDIPLKKKLIQEVGLARLCEIGPMTTRQLTNLLKFDLD